MLCTSLNFKIGHCGQVCCSESKLRNDIKFIYKKSWPTLVGDYATLSCYPDKQYFYNIFIARIVFFIFKFNLIKEFLI